MPPADSASRATSGPRSRRTFGFKGLLPKRRSDRARPRRMPPEVVETLLSIKTWMPGLSVCRVIEKAREEGKVADNVHLPQSTVHHLFAREGLIVRPPSPQQDMLRSAFRFADECGQSDVLHGRR